jgi:hypothetical protein
MNIPDRPRPAEGFDLWVHRAHLLLALAVLSLPTAAFLVVKSAMRDRLPHDVRSALWHGGEVGRVFIAAGD